VATALSWLVDLTLLFTGNFIYLLPMKTALKLEIMGPNWRNKVGVHLIRHRRVHSLEYNRALGSKRRGAF
jgi:hypothetical protein